VSEQLIRLDIKDLAFDGKSVAYNDGKVVFLQGGLPGETVLAEITQKRPRYDHGIVREVLMRAPERVEARCSHFEICGGCTWQDLDYEKQRFFKRKQVQDCLQRIGGLEAVTVDEVIGAPELFYYRNKMEYSFHIKPEGEFTLGLHHRGRFDLIFDLDRCHLQSEVSNRVVHELREYVKRNQIPVYDVMFHRGYMRFVIIREGKMTGQTMVNVVTNFGVFPDAERFAADLTEAVPEITTIVHNQNGGKSNIATGEAEEQVLYGPGYIEEKVLGTRFRIKANSFFQTNSRQVERLYSVAFDKLQARGDERVLDLYCGAGAIGLILAPKVRQVTGVELVPAAVAAARENAEINGIANCEFIEANVLDYLRSPEFSEKQFDVFVVDPPRAGMHPKALKLIIERRPARILYISCNPATFARDTKDLIAAGYHLPVVSPVDMFPHTMHIEVVGMFSL
jgi:23S rRNA (uracil1939-C5)-methyltransferase